MNGTLLNLCMKANVDTIRAWMLFAIFIVLKEKVPKWHGSALIHIRFLVIYRYRVYRYSLYPLSRIAPDALVGWEKLFSDVLSLRITEESSESPSGLVFGRHSNWTAFMYSLAPTRKGCWCSLFCFSNVATYDTYCYIVPCNTDFGLLQSCFFLFTVSLVGQSVAALTHCFAPLHRRKPAQFLRSFVRPPA